jgi:hypothetical protein
VVVSQFFSKLVETGPACSHVGTNIPEIFHHRFVLVVSSHIFHPGAMNLIMQVSVTF